MLNYDNTTAYEINHSGTFEVGRVVSKSTVTDALDIPQNARITDVDIESVHLVVTPLEGNQANKVKVTASIKDLNTWKENIFKDYEVPLTGMLGISNPFSPTSLLLDKGIEKLKGKVNNYVKNLDDLDMEIILDGESIPANSKMALNIKFIFKATIKYDECVEVPGAFNAGDKCDIE